MYNSRQHKSTKNSDNSSDKPAPSQFAPRGFVVHPKTEEVAPQKEQTPDSETQKEETKQDQGGLIDFSKLTPRPSPARTPRIQMKLTIGQPGDTLLSPEVHRQAKPEAVPFQELTRGSLQAETHPIQAKFTAAPTEKEPGRHFDDFLGSYIDKISNITEYAPWQRFYQAAENSWWIYMPPTSYRKEKYVRDIAVDLDKLKETDENEREDHLVKGKLESGDWASLTVTKELSQKDGELVLKAMEEGKNWKEFDNGLFTRISQTFPILEEGIKNKSLKLTPDLIKKVNEVIAPLNNNKKKQPDEKNTIKASQALTELDYAAKVISTQKLAAPFVLGAQSRVRSPGQKALPTQEETHGDLPPLGVLNMEVDAYYLGADGILHADEVKDTPNALADKAKDGGQIGRQIEWLTWDVLNPKTNKNYNKQVHYFVRSEGPKFDAVLSEAIINNLSLLDNFQMGVKFIHIGKHSFTVQDLQQLYDKAIDWLGKSNAALKRQGKKPSDAAKEYFGDIDTALDNIEKGPLS